MLPSEPRTIAPIMTPCFAPENTYMKYIVTEQADGTEEIFLFPRAVNHDCMADVLCHIRNHSHGNWKRISRVPIAAGFVEGGKCTGNSESLMLCSRPQDTLMLPWHA